MLFVNQSQPKSGVGMSANALELERLGLGNPLFSNALARIRRRFPVAASCTRGRRLPCRFQAYRLPIHTERPLTCFQDLQHAPCVMPVCLRCFTLDDAFQEMPAPHKEPFA